MVADFEGHRGIKKITTDWLMKWTIQGKRMESETLILLGGKKKRKISEASLVIHMQYGFI